jgi:hypothetical protein
MKRHSRSRAASRAAVAIFALGAALPAALSAQSTDSPVTIHGFLTQGVARSTQTPLFGIDTASTTDYRSAALQVRYAMSEADNFLIQLSHRRMGRSLLNTQQPDVAVDWVFYQRQFAGADVKLGRVPMPRGIYNEVRDVGTVLPFYRAPYNYYTEGMETVDGGAVRYQHGLGRGFGLDVAAFAGGFDFKQLSFSTSTGQMIILSSRAELAVGGNVWLNTPVTGVRVGASGQRFTFDRFQPTQGVNGARQESGVTYGLALDATRDRYYVRGEYGEFSVDGNTFRYPTWYAQAGVKPVSRLTLNAQTDRANVEQRMRVSPTMVVPFQFDYARDDAVGAAFAVSPNFVLKFEGHEARGYNFDRFVNPQGAAAETRYWVGSAAVSF